MKDVGLQNLRLVWAPRSGHGRIHPLLPVGLLPRNAVLFRFCLGICGWLLVFGQRAILVSVIKALRCIKYVFFVFLVSSGARVALPEGLDR